MTDHEAHSLTISATGCFRLCASLAAAWACLLSPAQSAATPVSCPGYQSHEVQGDAHDAFIRRYIECFNNQDFACLDLIYAHDLKYEGAYWSLSSKQDFFNFYEKAWRHLTEHITVTDVRSTENQAFVELSNRIEVFRDYPDFPSRPLKAGDILNLKGTVAYTIKDSKIEHICDR